MSGNARGPAHSNRIALEKVEKKRKKALINWRALDTALWQKKDKPTKRELQRIKALIKECHKHSKTIENLLEKSTKLGINAWFDKDKY